MRLKKLTTSTQNKINIKRRGLFLLARKASVWRYSLTEYVWSLRYILEQNSQWMYTIDASCDVYSVLIILDKPLLFFPVSLLIEG
jgi:hypothetical protein